MHFYKFIRASHISIEVYCIPTVDVFIRVCVPLDTNKSGVAEHGGTGANYEKTPISFEKHQFLLLFFYSQVYLIKTKIKKKTTNKIKTFIFICNKINIG